MYQNKRVRRNSQIPNLQKKLIGRILGFIKNTPIKSTLQIQTGDQSRQVTMKQTGKLNDRITFFL